MTTVEGRPTQGIRYSCPLETGTLAASDNSPAMNRPPMPDPPMPRTRMRSWLGMSAGRGWVAMEVAAAESCSGKEAMRSRMLWGIPTNLRPVRRPGNPNFAEVSAATDSP